MKLVISDNERELDVLSDPDIRLLQDGLDMPLVSRELTYAESADSDGRRRVRSKNQNAEGKIGLHISGTSESHFWDRVDNVIELVESAHRNKGSIVYEPPGGTAVAYDLESITVTGLPQRGIDLRQQRADAEITFEVLPYGRLDEVTLVSGGTLDGPIDYVTVENVPGQVMAWGDLELKDVSTYNRNFVEVAVQNDFDPTNPEPIFLTAGSMADAGGTLVGLAGLAGTANRPTGAYSNTGGTAYTIQARLSTEPVQVCSTGSQSHTGFWKARARVWSTTAKVRVRLAWRTGQGSWNRESWRSITESTRWLDIDLGTVQIPILRPTHSFEARIEAATTTGNPTLDIDAIALLPADSYLRLRGSSFVESTTSLLAADDFDTHSAGTLTGKTPPVTSGGNWGGAGDATDFDVLAGGVVVRGATSDSAGVQNGRFALAGTAIAAATRVQVDSRGAAQAGPDSLVGVFARYTNTSNFVLAYLSGANILGGVSTSLTLVKRVSGVTSTLASYSFSIFNPGFSWSDRTLVFEISSEGEMSVSDGQPGETLIQRIAYTPPPATATTVTTLGTTGSNPIAIAVDSSGNVYTTNFSSNSVTKITPAGVSTTLGTTGSDPIGIAVDSSANVYTANSGSNNVTKITPAGVSTTFGTTGSFPRAIALDSSGNVYTANSGSNNVTKITQAGVSTTLGTTGSAPWGIAVDSSGNVYTANYGSNNVTKITPAGNSSILGTTGAGPADIELDSAGNVYTANLSANNVTKITSAGVSTTLGTTGTLPRGIALDSSGNVYTANYGSNNVTKISPAGVSTTLGTTGSAPWGIAVDSSGNVYTANYGPNNVTKIVPGTANEFATGGALATGRYGFFHQRTAATTDSIEFDNFSVTEGRPPNASFSLPVIPFSREVLINHESAISASPDGSVFAPSPIREGNYLKLSPATRNAQKSRIVVRARRGDVETQLSDEGLEDRLAIELSAIPRVTLR